MYDTKSHLPRNNLLTCKMILLNTGLALAISRKSAVICLCFKYLSPFLVQIVLAAHLKPISREEKEELQRKSAEGKVVWNCAAGSGSGEAVEAGNEFRSLEKQEMRLPRTSGDFTKLWNQLGNYEEKWNVLRYLSGSGGEDRDGSILRKVCREEVSPEIFPDLVGCLREVTTSVLEGSKSVECRRDALEEILLVMKILSESKRFMLTLSFMSKKDRENVGVLLEGLRQALRNEDDSDESRGKAKILSNLFNHIEARYSPQTTDS